MTLEQLIAQSGGQAKFARLIGCHPPTINRVVKGHRSLGPALALRIFKVTGHRLGALADEPAKPSPPSKQEAA